MSAQKDMIYKRKAGMTADGYCVAVLFGFCLAPIGIKGGWGSFCSAGIGSGLDGSTS